METVNSIAKEIIRERQERKAQAMNEAKAKAAKKQQVAEAKQAAPKKKTLSMTRAEMKNIVEGIMDRIEDL